MLNINEQRIQEIKEGSKLLEENCRLICDSKLHLQLSKDCKNLDFTSSAKLFDYAQYIYYDGDLLKGQKVGNKYYYHCVKTGDFLQEYTQAKRPIKDKYSNRTNFTNNRYCVNLVTGLPMNTISKIDGLSLCDWDNRFDIDKNLSIIISSDT